MLTVVLEAGTPAFGFSPWLFLALGAPIAIALTVFLVRFRRKGDK